MIILDTNVVSALMRVELEPKVAAWLDQQDLRTLYVTSVTLFEIQFGIERMARGKKRLLHESRIADVLSAVACGRILDLEAGPAAVAAKIHVVRGKVKANHEAPDSLIAGIAIHHGAAVATRNRRDFLGLGLRLVDPWGNVR